VTLRKERRLVHIVRRFAHRLVALIAAAFFLEVQAGGLIEQRSYSIKIPAAANLQISVVSATFGPIIVLSTGTSQTVYDGRSGTPITRVIRTEEILRPVEFVTSTDNSPILDRFGCREIAPGCTSASDADFVLKVDGAIRSEVLRIEFFDLANLKDRFANAMKGEVIIQFDELDRFIIEDLVKPTGKHNNSSWRDIAIDNVLAPRTLAAVAKAKQNLQQFKFAESTELLPRRRFGNALIEESLRDKSEQLACRLLGAGIVNNYEMNKDNGQWLPLAMQEGMLKRCPEYSTHFRLGLFDAPRTSRDVFSKALRGLACSKQSEDFWCTSLALEGRSCEEVTMTCGSTRTEPKEEPKHRVIPESKPRIRQVSDSKGIESARINEVKDGLTLFRFKETLKQLPRDNSALGITFFARPADLAKDGKFEIEILPSLIGATLMKQNDYLVTVTLMLEVTRKDRCLLTLGCIFKAADKEYRRVEQKSLRFRLTGPEFRMSHKLDFGQLKPADGKYGLNTELTDVRLVVDRVTSLTAD